MKLFKLSLKPAQLLRWVPFGVVAIVLLTSAAAIVLTWPQSSVSLAGNNDLPPALQKEYSLAVKSLRELESRQRDMHAQVATESDISQRLSVISIDAQIGHFVAAHNDIKALKLAIINWNLELSTPASTPPAVSGVAYAEAAPTGMRLPILLYHYPPANFEAQLVHLEQAGYTTIDLDQALAGLHGHGMPAKPVVITFDDGFSAQMSAFEILKRHNMKATFYIIVGGENSRWCIGSGRRYGDPLQPSGGCGDGYLNWDQVRMLDQSGLIAIGGHTINHRNLAALSEADQRFEIETGKTMLEAQIGHTVRHFAYPYGQYNGTSIRIAQEAGYQTAVTTAPGVDQTAGSAFTLRRVRNAFDLP